MSDTLHVDICSESRDHLRRALSFVLDEVTSYIDPAEPGRGCWKCSRKVSAYRVTDGSEVWWSPHAKEPTMRVKGHLVLYSESVALRKDATKFLYPMGIDDVTVFVDGWLKQVEYPAEPDIDGDCHRGWRVYNGEQIGALVAIAPHWALYGK